MNAGWQPSATTEVLQQRAELLWKIREFFRHRDICEVQTPTVGTHTVTDLHIESLQLADGRFLQTSPEYFLKRLLAAGMTSCYQIGPVFREGELGQWHNPEFTMLEWYRIGFTAAELRSEVSELVDLLLHTQKTSEYTFRDLLYKELQIDCFSTTTEQLLKVARTYGFEHDSGRNEVLDYLYSAAVARSDDSRYFVTDFPAESSALAEIHERDGYQVADRFELIIEGMEIANGYQELRDAEELNSRMDRDRVLRRKLNKPDVEKDQRLLEAMEAGLPKCSGVAVGLDRLVALSVGASTIEQVISFAHDQI